LSHIANEIRICASVEGATQFLKHCETDIPTDEKIVEYIKRACAVSFISKLSLLDTTNFNTIIDDALALANTFDTSDEAPPTVHHHHHVHINSHRMIETSPFSRFEVVIEGSLGKYSSS
jgi:hypothetical protein